MAKKLDNDFLADSKKENRNESRKFQTNKSEEAEPAAVDFTSQGEATEPLTASNTNTANTNNSFTIPPPQEPEKDLFKERFDEYFKGMDGMIGGQIAVNLVDDLKASFLLMYAKKQGIEIEKSALLMDDKTKNFAAFLVDHAIKNNFFDIIKKYPILAALGVIVISGGSTFLMLQMLKGMKTESKQKDDEISQLKKDIEALQKNSVKEPVPVNNSNPAENLDIEKAKGLISMQKVEQNTALKELLEDN